MSSSTDPTHGDTPGHAPVTREHRAQAFIARWGRPHSPSQDWHIAWVEHGIADWLDGKLLKCAAQVIADAEQRGARAERERVVRLARSLGYESFEQQLVEAIERGDHLRSET